MALDIGVKMRVKLTFIEPVLGVSPADPELYRRFIGNKAPDAETVEEEVSRLGADAVADRAMTVFPRKDGVPFFWAYQIKSAFKDACGGLRRVAGTKSATVKAYKKIIDKNIFVFPREILFSDWEPITECQRPLRASTPQGERISLANSEQIPAGASIVFTVHCLSETDIPLVKEWLDYGECSGMGQWRNSGKGRFTWEELPLE